MAIRVAAVVVAAGRGTRAGLDFPKQYKVMGGAPMVRASLCIFTEHPEVDLVLPVIPFGLVGVPLQAMFHTAAFIAAGVPVFDIREKFGPTDMLVSNREKGVALASVMGGKNVVLMRAHGSVACGPTLQTAVFRAVYTEVNARIQHWTMALKGGETIAALDPEEGRLADAINQTAAMRAWELWRKGIRDEVNW